MDVQTVNTETWHFCIGDWITHKTQSMPSLVMRRVRTSKGLEVYGVRSFATVDPNRDRMILADSLKPIDDEAWADCLLTPEMAAEMAA